MEKFKVYNAIKTPDGTILESMHQHDYNTYTDKNGEFYMIDGGLGGYTRYSVNKEPFEDLSVYSDAPHEIIREKFSRGNIGKNRDKPLRYVLLKDIDDEWLNAIITYEQEFRPNNKFLPIYLKEINYRKNLADKK